MRRCAGQSSKGHSVARDAVGQSASLSGGNAKTRAHKWSRIVTHRHYPQAPADGGRQFQGAALSETRKSIRFVRIWREKDRERHIRPCIQGHQNRRVRICLVTPMLPYLEHNRWRVTAISDMVLCFCCSSKVYALKQIEGAGLSLSACREIAVSLAALVSVCLLSVCRHEVSMVWVTYTHPWNPEEHACFLRCCFFPLPLSPATTWAEARQCHKHATCLPLTCRSEGVVIAGLCGAWSVGKCLHKWHIHTRNIEWLSEWYCGDS